MRIEGCTILNSTEICTPIAGKIGEIMYRIEPMVYEIGVKADLYTHFCKSGVQKAEAIKDCTPWGGILSVYREIIDEMVYEIKESIELYTQELVT